MYIQYKATLVSIYEKNSVLIHKIEILVCIRSKRQPNEIIIILIYYNYGKNVSSSKLT